MTGDFKQSYKNRKRAFVEFVQAQNLPVSQGKFYDDCERLRMVQADKSVEISALMAYVKNELKLDLATGQSLVERDYDKKLADLDLREKELKVAKLEREERKDDKKWILRESAYEREGALVGAILTEGVYRSSRAAEEVIALCGGDPARLPETRARLKNIFYQTLQTIYDSGEIDIAFEKEEEEEDL